MFDALLIVASLAVSTTTTQYPATSATTASGWSSITNAEGAPDGNVALSTDPNQQFKPVVFTDHSPGLSDTFLVQSVRVVLRVGQEFHEDQLYADVAVAFASGGTPGTYQNMGLEDETLADYVYGLPDQWNSLSADDLNNGSWAIRCVANGLTDMRLDAVTLVVVGCEPDYTGDGDADQDDIDCLVAIVASGSDPCSNEDPDFNHDGNVDQGDVLALMDAIAFGTCP